jgi:hypothetical protein
MSKYKIIGIDNHRRNYGPEDVYKIRSGLLHVSRDTADLVLQMKHQLKNDGYTVKNADDVIRMAIEALKIAKGKEYLMKYGNIPITQIPCIK